MNESILLLCAACLAAGVVSGFIGALFGVGGGLVIVPTLAFAFTLLQVPESVRVHLAVGTSLATIIFVSVSSVRAHHRMGKVPWPRVRAFAPPVAAGAAAGGYAATLLPGAALKVTVGGFALLMAARLAAFGNRDPSPSDAPKPLSGVVGALIGAVSAIVGIGGGSLSVPYFLYRNIPIHQAIPFSSACGLPIAICGAGSFVILGLSAPGLPPYSVGYVSLPALIAIGAASVLTAPLGARVAHALPARLLRRLFIALLVAVGTIMVFA